MKMWWVILLVVVGVEGQLERVVFCEFLEAANETWYWNVWNETICWGLYEKCMEDRTLLLRGGLRFECNGTAYTSLTFRPGNPTPIPTQIGYLQSLQYLSLFPNMNSSLPTQIGLLTKLSVLMINVLGEATVSFPPQLANLNLGHISISGNAVTFPDISGSVSMGSIFVHAPVTGTIPSYIFKLPLHSLQLEETQLEGTIPTLIGSITSLHILTILNNRLLSGTIPFEIGCGCRDLEILQILGNVGISGTLPPELGLLRSLSNLVINGNGISGTIPMEYGFTENRFDDDYQWCLHTPPNFNENATELKTISISNQPGLIGTIPPELTQFPLNSITLSGNSLKGTIPVEIVSTTYIKYLYLQDNQIGGTLPNFNGTHIIKTINVSNNKISGTIPPELVKLVDDFEARNNQLTGALPRHPSRVLFFLSGNNLNGTIPYEYCSYTFSQIRLGGNLSGCWYDCKPLRAFNTSTVCDLKGSTFGCNSQCGAPPGCGASCNAMYNNYPYVYPTPEYPSTPSLPSPPSIHSPSSLVDFINTEVNITKPKWTSLNSTNSTITIMNYTSSVIIVNISGNWTDQKSEINAEGHVILNANSINFQSSNINLNNADLNINTGKFVFVGNLIMTLNSTLLMNGECADFSNSNLFVKVPDNFYGVYNETILVNTTNNCMSLFKSVQGMGSGCQEVNIKQKNHGSAIGVSFTVTNHCDPLSVATIAATASCLFVAIAAIVLVFAHPKIKKKVLPFKGRKAHTPYTNPDE